MNKQRISLGALVSSLVLANGWVFSSDGTAPSNRGSSRLVTGDPANLSAVAGAPAGLTFYFTPRPALPGTDPSLPYPAGSSINGQVLTAPHGGFTSAWITQIAGWDPDQNGQPLLRSMQDKVDAQGFRGANAVPANAGCDLIYPASSFACARTCVGGANAGHVCLNNGGCPGSTCGPDPCAAMLGEPGPRCGGTIAGICDWGWQNTCGADGSCAPPKRADWILATDASSDQFAAAAILSPTGPIFGAASAPGVEIFDSGGKFYTGTLVLPVPICAKGLYTIGHVANETFAQDEAQPGINIPIAGFVAGQLSILLGSCCTNLGANGTCTAEVTSLECDNLAAGSAHVWRNGVDCEVACPACAQEPCPLGIVSTDPPVCTIDARYPHDPNNALQFLGYDRLTLTLSRDPQQTLTCASNIVMSNVPSSPPFPTCQSIIQNGAQVTVVFSRPVPPERWVCVELHLTGDPGPSFDKACIGALPPDTDQSRLSETADTTALMDGLDGNPALQVWQRDIDRSTVFSPLDILASIDLLNGAGAFKIFRGTSLLTCPTVGIP